MTRPPLPAPPHQGGCLCGAVRYRFDARPWALNACHCMDCKKLTGATNLLMVLGPREAFSFDGPVERYRKRADSGNEIDIVRQLRRSVVERTVERAAACDFRGRHARRSDLGRADVAYLHAQRFAWCRYSGRCVGAARWADGSNGFV
jgi:hypothetical protein